MDTVGERSFFPKEENVDQRKKNPFKCICIWLLFVIVIDSQDQTNSSVLATLAALAEATAPNTSTQGMLSKAKK